MSNILFKLSLPCTLLLTAAMLLVHTPIYAAADLETVLVPPTNCAAPCFMGITPGVTTVDKAIQQLQANPVIESISVDSFDRYNAQSIEAFVALPLEREALLLYAEEGIVQSIRLSGHNIRLGDIVLLLGQPDQFALNETLHMDSITYAVFYPQYNLTAAVDLPKCTLDMNTFWNAQRFVSIGIKTDQGYAEQTDYYLTGAYQSSESWVQQLREIEHEACE